MVRYSEYKDEAAASAPVEASAEPIEETSAPVVTPDPNPERSVYDGDISDSLLSKLSAYYNEHSCLGDAYTITRPSQYRYELVYGESSDGVSYDDATLVVYQYTNTGYGQGAPVVTVSDGVSRVVDVSGSTGYVYSSAPEFIPSRYIDMSSRLSNHVSSLGLLVLLVCIIAGWFLTLVKGKRNL